MPVFCVDGLRSGTWRTLVALVLLASGVVIAHLMLCSATGAGAGSGGADGLPAEWVQKVEVALEDAHSMCVTLRGVEFVHCFRNVLYKLHTVGDGWTSPILYYYVDGIDTALRRHCIKPVRRTSQKQQSLDSKDNQELQLLLYSKWLQDILLTEPETPTFLLLDGLYAASYHCNQHVTATATVKGLKTLVSPVGAEADAAVYIGCVRQVFKDVAKVAMEKEGNAFLANDFAHWIDGYNRIQPSICVDAADAHAVAGTSDQQTCGAPSGEDEPLIEWLLQEKMEKVLEKARRTCVPLRGQEFYNCIERVVECSTRGPAKRLHNLHYYCINSARRNNWVEIIMFTRYKKAAVLTALNAAINQCGWHMTASVGAIREKGDPVSAKVNADMYIQCLRQIIKDVATEKEDYETFIAFNFSYWIEGYNRIQPSICVDDHNEF